VLIFLKKGCDVMELTFNEKADSTKRFIVSASNGTDNEFQEIKVLVDIITGVNYLYVRGSGEGAGLSVMVDGSGKPIVTPVNH